MSKAILLLYFDRPFAEQEYRSWTTDHLSSIACLIERVNTLDVFHVKRIPRAMLCGNESEALDSTLVPTALQPRPLPDGFLAVLMQHGSNLKDISLNFWDLSYDRLRTLFQTSPNLLAVQLLLDAPFSKLVRI